MRWLAVIVIVMAAGVGAVPAAVQAAKQEDEFKLRLSEVSTGEVYPDGSRRVGHTFSGRARGELDGNASLSFDYEPPNAGPKLRQSLVGGQWSVVTPRGEVFGVFTRGSITWNDRGHKGELKASASVTGGTGAFAGATGSGVLEGVINRTDTPPRLKAELHLRR